MSGEIVTVFGGSGFIGRNIVRELARAGYRVRVAVRRPNEAMFLLPMGTPGQIGLFQVNIRDEASVAGALRGAHAAVNAVGILYQSGRQKFKSVQLEGAGRIARLAAQAGVKRLIHVSAIGADPKSGPAYAKSKGKGEALVWEHFPSATILRPSIVFGPEDDFFNRFAAMAQLWPAIPVVGGGKTKFQPVHVDDVADAALVCLNNASTQGRIFELGGPKVMTFKECLRLMLTTIHRKTRLVTLPFLFARIIAFFTQLWPFGAPLLTPGQVRMLKKDTVVGMTGDASIGTLADLGVSPTAADVILPTYLVHFRPRGQYNKQP
jgi:NADH dehydrogenase